MGQLAISEPVRDASASQDAPQTIVSYAPGSGERLGEVPIMTGETVASIARRSRTAQQAWGALPVRERCERILRFRDAMVDRMDEVVDLLSQECGKPRQEALVHEVTAVANMATYFADAAPRVLASHEVPMKLLKHRRSFVHYKPYGVVAVIAPWNFPLQIPLRDALIALVAGNSVIIKPSEVTPLIAMLAKEIWDGAGLPEDVLQVVTGLGATGAALIDAKPDFVAFTGGVATGRRVAAACGERLIPCVMELGGKAPLIACADADIERTARGIVFGGFANCGQVCVSVERVYAHEAIYDALVDRVVTLTEAIRQGDPAEETVDVGAIIFPRQMTVADAHIADATSKGARVRTGGRRRETSAGQFYPPTVLSECDHSMTVMTEEIFGPIVPFMKVQSEEEALRLANDSPLGLNAYVFSRDRARAARLAERIEAGGVLVNDVLTNGATPDTPFGGIKDSGFGRVMGDESLRDMCSKRMVSVDRVATQDDPLWFPYTDGKLSWLKRATRLMFSGGNPIKKLTELF